MYVHVCIRVPTCVIVMCMLLRYVCLYDSYIRMTCLFEACFFTAEAPLKEINKARTILENSFNESPVSQRYPSLIFQRATDLIFLKVQSRVLFITSVCFERACRLSRKLGNV